MNIRAYHFRHASLARHGFTLIELLVIIAIIGMLATLVVTRFATSRVSFDLQNAKSLAGSDIRKVITWAQTGKTCCGETLPPAYGVEFTAGTDVYTIFADRNGNGMYEPATDDSIEQVNTVGNQQFNNVSLLECQPADGNGACALVVQVPNGRMTINGVQNQELSLRYQHTEDAAQSIDLFLDTRSGQIR